ncbi:uncharacterized protein LOC127728727 [Mytilus californianus]|uniref:uncharacterized protein LOC127728727 n=1 Tax=Mytilus californianus TaxID=6549 RepID=UPI002245CCE5|nr:uncharacterized protein LOC127728727 [Mytilus californianus]
MADNNTKPEPRYEPVYLDRPPIEQWMAEERENAWLEYQEAKKEFPELTKPKSRPIEFMVPYVGLPVAGCLFIYAMWGLRRRKLDLPMYLIHTRLAVQGTIVMSFAAIGIGQSARHILKTYFNIGDGAIKWSK